VYKRQVGVLTSKKLRGALEDGKEGRHQADFEKLSITDVLKRFEVQYGHYYNDSRASNAFQDSDALILLGSNRLELATAQARHRALRRIGAVLSFGEYYDSVNRGEIDQAIGRGRSLRRDVLTLVYGSIEPTKHDDDGIVWRTKDLKGREALGATLEAEEYALENALDGAHVKAKDLIYFGISERTCRRIINQMSQHEKLTLEKEGKINVLRLHEDYLLEAQERWNDRKNVHNEARQEALVVQDQTMVTTENIVLDLIKRTKDEDMIFLSDALGELDLPPGLGQEIKRGVGAEEDEIGATFTTTRVGDDLLIYKGRSRHKIEGYDSALLSILIRWIEYGQKRDLPPHIQSRRAKIYRRLKNPRLEGVLMRVRKAREAQRRILNFRAELYQSMAM
jgi:hypothetical protein